MKTKGIRILDKNGRTVSVELADILKEIPNGNEFFWSILVFDAQGKIKNGKSNDDLERESSSEQGSLLTWKELNDFAMENIVIIDLIVIGCKDKSDIKRYNTEREMYESYDYYIDKFDTSYWEIFSKDEQWINQLATKFKDVKFLESDFLEKNE